METSVILSSEQIDEELKEVTRHYPKLKVIERQRDKVVIKGDILVNRRMDNFTVSKTYEVEIEIYLDSDKLPSIKECGGKIQHTYEHIYTDNSLCLETDVYMKWYFRDGFHITQWIEGFVEPYFLSYEFYMKYDKFPFGERAHGVVGILESYKDMLKAKDIKIAYKIMSHIANNRYRGHWECPCGSGKRIRNCHGESMIPFYNNENLYKCICDAVNFLKGDKK